MSLIFVALSLLKDSQEERNETSKMSQPGLASLFLDVMAQTPHRSQ
jgi:hypothetical protein